MRRKSKEITRLEFNKKAMEIFGTVKISREQAKSNGLMFFWPENSCERGHLTYRYTSNGMCRQCVLDDNYKRNYSESCEEIEKFKPRLKAEKLKYELELEKLNKEYDYDFD